MEKKIFTAELQRARMQGRGGTDGGQPSNAEILQAILGLRDDVARLGRLPAALPEVPPEPAGGRSGEVDMLRTELRALALCIQQTKLEIAALRPNQAEEDRLMAVTFELDAIVTATERATQSILDSSERVDNLAAGLHSHIADSYGKQLAEDIREQVGGIFEACNFQDITGQRITKVVNTLKYVEDRINAMIDIWGVEGFVGLPTGPAPASAADDEAGLLNGPQLENRGITQAEIDKLFG